MSYDTTVEHNVYWFGDRKITVSDSEGTLPDQIEHAIAERLKADGQDTVHADNGADEYDVVVNVKLVLKLDRAPATSAAPRKCYDKSCTEPAAVRVRGMLGGDIDPHDYCLRHAAQYCQVSNALGVPSRAEPIL